MTEELPEEDRQPYYISTRSIKRGKYADQYPSITPTNLEAYVRANKLDYITIDGEMMVSTPTFEAILPLIAGELANKQKLSRSSKTQDAITRKNSDLVVYSTLARLSTSSNLTFEQALKDAFNSVFPVDSLIISPVPRDQAYKYLKKKVESPLVLYSHPHLIQQRRQPLPLLRKRLLPLLLVKLLPLLKL